MLLYELLTGTTPLDKTGIQQKAYEELCRQIRETEAPKPSARISTLKEAQRSTIAQQRHVDPKSLRQLLRGDLDRVVLKALEKDRDQRYESPKDLAADIGRFLDDKPVQAVPPSPLYLARKYMRRHKVAILTAATIFTLSVLVTAFSSWQAIRATNSEKVAENERNAAVAAKNEAVDAKQQAMKSEEAAISAREEAERTAEELRHELYAFQISSAAEAYEHDNFLKMREYLDQCPEDLRHWEWHRLNWLVRDTELFTLRGAELPLFTADGRHLLSADFREANDYSEAGAYGQGDQTNAVVVWDAKSGQRVGQLAGHHAPVSSLALSADNHRLATCDVRGEMIVWDLRSGPLAAKEVQRWKAHNGKSDGLRAVPHPHPGVFCRF